MALAKTALGGMLGIDVCLENLPGTVSRDDFALYSESQGRIVVTIHPDNRRSFENLMRGIPLAQIGTVREDDHIVMKGQRGDLIISTTLQGALQSYKSTFRDY